MTNDRRRTTDDDLRQEVEGLAAVIIGTKATLDNLHKTYSTRDEIKTARRRTAAGVVISVLLAVMAMLAVNNYLIKRCFLGAPPPGRDDLCNAVFHGYNDSVDRAHQEVEDLQVRAKDNKERLNRKREQIEEIARQLAEIRRELNLPERPVPDSYVSQLPE